MLQRGLRKQDLADLFLLGALWGGSFLFMRMAVHDFGPIALIQVRATVGALFLAPFLWRRWGEVRGHVVKLLVLGVINTAIPFSLFAYTVQTLPAGFTSILNSTAPFFTALVAWAWLKQSLSPLRVVGLLIGFSGVSLLVWHRLVLNDGGSTLPILASLLAAFFYGIAANYAKVHLSQVSPLAVAAGSLIGASLVLLPFTLCLLPSETPSLTACLAGLGAGVFSTGISYILYFRLIANIGATHAIAVTFLIPVFGMLWGHWFLAEQISVNMLVGVAVILFGMSLTTGLLQNLWTAKR